MPPEPFGFVQIFTAAAFILLALILIRYYGQTGRRMIRYGIGGVVGVISAVLFCYFFALVVTPFISQDYDYHFKFWGIFVGLSLITSIAGALLSIKISQNLDSQKSGENNED